jgi:predicted O-methyltransferase YrrM
VLTRTDNFFNFLAINESDLQMALRASAASGERAQGMTDIKDYYALAAIALHYRPKRIFEIGTYLGVTSDFFLSLLPECQVVSIAYINPLWRFLRKFPNNSELLRKKIGSEVHPDSRTRFTQLYGDSHKLRSKSLVEKYGYFDLVFIDGDHSAKGVSLDTELAKEIITVSGVICWHDANPKPRYMDVRRFLESEPSFSAIATKDEYTGGVAAWSREIEEKLNSNQFNSQQSAGADG